MTIEHSDGALIIRELPIEQMAFLSMGIPMDGELAQVLNALLSGKRVVLAVEGLEYKRYKKTAPLGAYQKFMGMEREIREMGIYVIRQGR